MGAGVSAGPPPAGAAAGTQTKTSARLRQAIAFLGSFLLFNLEILATKMLLPSFGGAAYVWTASCMFFQAVLLAGYLYSLGALKWAGPMKYARRHVALLLLPLLCFPIAMKLPDLIERPMTVLLGCLLVSIGAPFFVLSTTSPVMQSWAVAEGEHDAYEIYAASNFGALLALLSYPFLVEPYTELHFQLKAWQALYFVYAGLHLTCLPRQDKRGKPVAGANTGSGLVWFMLALGPSASMLAATNLLTLDFAAVPLLWIAPLAIYLSTFILSFKKNPWYPKRLSMTAVVLMVVWLGFVLLTVMFSADFAQKWIAVRRLWAVNKFMFMCAALFIVCIICHKALAQSRPAGKDSPRFYAWIGAGGWAGSVLIGVVMPFIGRHTAMPELDWAIAGILSLAALVVRDRKHLGEMLISKASISALSEDGGKNSKLRVTIVALCGVIVLGGAGIGLYVNRSLAFSEGIVYSLRNFYGYYTVVQSKGFRKFYHGNTLHGMQYLDPAKQDTPLVYYHHGSPIGELLRLNKESVSSIGVVGLGVGVLAADGYAGQHFDFYELDPDVAKIAEEYFVFLRDSPSQWVIHTGDARLSLERDPTRKFDLLILDAFTGGAIPVHLLTRQALQMYEQRLNGDSLIAFHITNRFLNLRPMLSALAASEGFVGVAKKSYPGRTEHDEQYYSSWVVMSKDSAKIKPLLDAGWEDLAPMAGGTKPWTDEYASLWAALGN
jgi:hypothetical protein